MDNFYVYMYLRAHNSEHGGIGSPYYVGKGFGSRAFDKAHRCKPPSDKSRIVFVSVGLTEDSAYLEEKRLIAFYGRIDNGTGCLANLTDGGEGQCGRAQTEEEKRQKSHWMKAHPNRGNALIALTCHTPEARAKAAASNRGKKRSQEFCEAASERKRGKKPTFAGWNKGIPRTGEQKRRHSELLSGRKQSLEAVANRSAANRASSIAMFGCTGIERRKMRRRERYAELKRGNI